MNTQEQKNYNRYRPSCFLWVFSTLCLFLLFSFYPIEAKDDRKICLNMIVKNESKVITRCLESVKDLIDYWVIVDTGSTDGTQQIIKDYLKNIPGELHERPWVDFAHNRNQAIELSHGKGDYLLFIDADEILILNSSFDKKSLDKDYYYIDVCDPDFDGTKFHRLQFVNNHFTWQWKDILHEYLLIPEGAQSGGHLAAISCTTLSDGHRSVNTNKFEHDIQVLNDALKKDPLNSRYLFYLGQSYHSAGQYELAIETYEKRAQMEGIWDKEVFWSIYTAAKLKEHLNRPGDNILEGYYKAHKREPLRAEPLYRLADHYFRSGQPSLAYAFCKKALPLTLPNDGMYVEEWIYDFGLYALYGDCAFNLKKYDEAKVAYEHILKQKTLPQEIREKVKLRLSSFSEKKSNPTLGIFAPSGIGYWDPSSTKSGITGSEEAVIYISSELAKLGYKVTVFGNPSPDSPYRSETANPRFVDFDFNDGSKMDIGIVWRFPTLSPYIKTRAKDLYLWPHDLWTTSLKEEEVKSFKDVLWLSRYQYESWLSFNPAFKSFKTILGNGLTPSQLEPIKERLNPFSCIYASNYGRGLDVLLDAWPQVKKAFPKATLDIYYGWEAFGLLTKEKETKLREQVKNLAHLGVKEHGQVGHEELMKAYARSSFWTYPCTSPETFCITAIRAQAAGAIPVIIEGSALKETVRHGYKCANKEDFTATLMKAMKDAKHISLKDRSQMKDFVLKEFTWEIIAKKWKETFDEKSL